MDAPKMRRRLDHLSGTSQTVEAVEPDLRRDDLSHGQLKIQTREFVGRTEELRRIQGTNAAPGNRQRSDRISTLQAIFPQKIGITTDAFQADREYLMNQRRRNLRVGESRQGPSGEPETELTKHSGDWPLMDGTRESSCSERDDG